MKLSDVKHKIDAYFNSVSGGEIVRQFEALGYEFEEADEHPFFDYELNMIPVSSVSSLFIDTDFSSENDDVLIQFRHSEQTMSIEIMNLDNLIEEDIFVTNNSNLNIAYAMAA